jgi:hypothetical protein
MTDARDLKSLKSRRPRLFSLKKPSFSFMHDQAKLSEICYTSVTWIVRAKTGSLYKGFQIIYFL